ncbi:anaplastic lymphoma kinase isoform X3 [Augochlora pura]
MIRGTRSGVSTANSRQACHYTGHDCRCRFRFTGDLLLRILLGLCYIIGTCCDWKERMPQATKKIHFDRSRMPELGYCDFESPCNSWWNVTIPFKRVTPDRSGFGPMTDASNMEHGHFLWFTGVGNVQLWSSTIPRTSTQCMLELALYQVEMNDGVINLVIITNNTSSITGDKQGNNRARWEKLLFNLGAISQPHQLLLELFIPHENSSVGVDNIRLIDCFQQAPRVRTICTDDMFRCNNGTCLNNTQICNLIEDCADGEDEKQNCDKIPKNARCNFEDGWCGWKNVPGKLLNWTLHRGPTPSGKTGPSHDHTFRNQSGTYAYVNVSKALGLGSSGTIESPLFNPTPLYSSDKKSPYYRSCQVRFFYHQFGRHSGSLGLYLVQKKPHQKLSDVLWWSYGDKGDIWYSHAVALPDVRYRYSLQFEVSRGISSTGDVAIDDFSLSPECFGIGVPPDVVGDFNYSNPVIPDVETIPGQHADFMNKTVVRITTCGAIGRTGPTAEQCAEQYNRTDIELVVPSTQLEDATFHLNGVQRWMAPSYGYYTLIGLGARGGKGSSGMGETLGALVRGVIELEKGDQLYFMVGQPGIDACPKNFRLKTDSCQTAEQTNGTDISGFTSTIRDVKKFKIRDGGGGGGGATYIFRLKKNGVQQPILIAGGGGGIGLGQFVNTGLQHGQGPVPPGKQPIPGPVISHNNDGVGGPGGGWNGSSNDEVQRTTAGTALVQGGIGGIGCGPENHDHGNGGFGGGGGGCRTGGGGGGYIGGDTGHTESSNGEGGYSYVSHELIHVQFRPAINREPGEVYIIQAISGCGCDYRCIALDQYLSETKCLCPPGWLLSNDLKSCVMADSKGSRQMSMIVKVTVIVILAMVFSAICLIIYNRYKSRKALSRQRRVMFGNGTELRSFPAVTDTMMTEFNPNYEFAGNLYSFKDLPQIPRDYIRLEKALGQGAFGEVFQGIYKYRCDEHPVAVKTIPSSSTPQTEADFMMEALIMSKFNHPNIVHFIGVSFDKNPKYIVLELLAGGNLKDFLREERPRADRPTSLGMMDLIMCGYDVASGCKYMEEARFIHRDIAARNCLLTCKEAGRVVKIADFGMAKDIYRSDYYRKGGKAMLPIKWMPPESFLDGIFTTKTDVWAFGVLLWEIMSFGYVPYTGCSNRQTMTMVTSGGRLEKPAGCPDPIYGIMTRCWHPRPEDRPSFATIVERIGYCLQDPDVTNHPMPNFDILPICQHEITIMRPDPEAECINVQSESKDKADSSNDREENSEHRISEDIENSGKSDNSSDNGNNRPSETESRRSSTIDIADVDKRNANDSTTTTDINSDSLIVASTDKPPETTNLSPSTRTCSPTHAGLNTTATTNVNGMLKKTSLKAALSLDPSALCRGKIPYEKMAFSPQVQRSSTPGSMEIKKDPMVRHLPREEECSC